MDKLIVALADHKVWANNSIGTIPFDAFQKCYGLTSTGLQNNERGLEIMLLASSILEKLPN